MHFGSTCMVVHSQTFFFLFFNVAGNELQYFITTCDVMTVHLKACEANVEWVRGLVNGSEPAMSIEKRW